MSRDQTVQQYLAERCRSLATEIQGATEQGTVSLTPEAFAAARALESLADQIDPPAPEDA